MSIFSKKKAKKQEKERIEAMERNWEKNKPKGTKEFKPTEVYNPPTVSEVPQTAVIHNGTAQASTGTKKTGITKAPVPASVPHDEYGNVIYYSEKYVPRPSEKSLTIILVEDTAEMKAQDANLVELYTRCKSDFLTIIHYGEKLRIKDIEIHKFFKKDNDNEANSFKISEDAGDKACFSDAVLETVKIVSTNLNKIKEKNFVKTKITKINIIGIGTCKDNCSNSPREKAIEDFCKMLNSTNISSKYLCTTEEYFFDAAEFGFRSIGSISETYQ